MILRALLLLLATCGFLRAGLPFQLPAEAEYSASDEAIALAKTNLSANLTAKPAGLTNLFASPMMCGPGLWDVVKTSPHFAKPPAAMTATKIMLSGGKSQLAPLALLQSEEEVASFRKALADLLASEGKLTIREPTKAEFMAFWSAIPLNTITGPLLAAEGKDVTIFCHFENGKILWADEVKRALVQK
jgi:hypothetical protein